ncbi:MAG: SDR family oxidoreductase [Epsilonproteobacteria bacterium]|nr:SDR family oxidoreductase [Campylobacterota bacterium]
MKKALVTGSSSGIGEEIAKRLLYLGYEVWGVARDFEKCDIKEDLFKPISCDLSDKKSLHEFLRLYKKEEFDILVNCAGYGRFAPHEEISIKDIEGMVYLNLTAPLLITKTFLRTLKKNRGHIFNICSISGIKSAPFGAVYGASKAGLRHFGKSLFAEVRKSGLKVININPDITDTPFFKELNFKPSSDPLGRIIPQDIADIVEDVLKTGENVVLTDITVEPQLFKISKGKR